MAHLTTVELIEHGFIQVNGMKKFPEDAKGAPFKWEKVEEQTKKVQELKTRQESLKADLQKATQELTTAISTLEEETSRNVSYFAGIWGKQDKKLVDVGGHPLGTHHRHPTTEKT